MGRKRKYTRKQKVISDAKFAVEEDQVKENDDKIENEPVDDDFASNVMYCTCAKEETVDVEQLSSPAASLRASTFMMMMIIDDDDDYPGQIEKEAALHSPYYTIFGPVWGVSMEKFKMTTAHYQIKWREIEKSPDVEQTVLTALEAILQMVYSDGLDSDMLSCIIDHKDLYNPIDIPFTNQAEWTAYKLCYEIAKQTEFGEMTIGPDLQMAFI